MTTQSPPIWDLSTGFPVEIQNASSETLVGALLAVLDHQSRFITRSVEGKMVMHQRSLFTSPAVYLPKLIQMASHHEERAMRTGRGRRHGALIDKLTSALPNNLPVIVPVTKRWESYRAFRSVRDFLWSSWANYREAYEQWKVEQNAMGQDPQPDPDLESAEPDNDEDEAKTA